MSVPGNAQPSSSGAGSSGAGSSESGSSGAGATGRAAASGGQSSPHASDQGTTFVSRGGFKLDHALRTFAIDARGMVCADLGCSTGGFTDCLLRAGAAKVYAVDTAYGELAWTLRNDPRVVVMERKNALHVEPPERVGLVVCDLSWTPQRLVIPAAKRWLTPGGSIVTLIKPHYEHTDRGGQLPKGGVLDAETAERVTQETATLIATLGMRVLGLTKSPILGSGGKATGKTASAQAAAGAMGKGNAEWLAWVG